jgi:signal transduction histidine kinase
MRIQLIKKYFLLYLVSILSIQAGAIEDFKPTLPFYHKKLLTHIDQSVSIEKGCLLPFPNVDTKGHILCQSSHWRISNPQDFLKTQSDGNIRVEKIWSDLPLNDGSFIPGRSFGTAILNFESAGSQSLHLVTRVFTFNVRVWKWTDLGLIYLDGIGDVDLSIDTPHLANGRILFPIETGVTVWEISNQYSARSGFRRKFQLGDLNSILMANAIEDYEDLFLVSCFFIFSILQFLYWSLRKSQMESLWLAFLSLNSMLRVFSQSHLSKNLEFLHFLEPHLIVIEYFSLSIYCLIGLYITSTIKDLKYKNLGNYSSLLAIPGIFILVLFPNGGFTNYLNYHLLSLLFVFFANLFMIVSGYKFASGEDRIKIKILFFIILVFIILSLNDWLYSKSYVSSRYMIQYAILIMVISQGYIVAYSNSLSRSKMEKLFFELQEETKAKEKVAAEKVQTEEFLKSISDEYLSTQSNLIKAKEELDQASNQLIQAEKLSSLGAMVAGIAHEINNPVNFIEMSRFQEKTELDELKNYLFGLVPEGEEGRAFKESLEEKFKSLYELNAQIQTGVKRVVEINHSMRNAARTDLEKTPNVDMSELIQESLLILGGKAKEYQVERKEEEIGGVTCKRSQIGQVVMNLVSNACDALKERKEKEGSGFQGKILVSLRKGEALGTVEIAVENNGYGIPEEKWSKVFEAFYTTKPVGVGTGLGLAICAKIISDHGGKIQVGQSESLEGAKFTIILPLS